MEKLSFVIPCYNSETTVSAVVDEIISEVNKLGYNEYEIVLVSDASPDNVYAVITDLAENNYRIKGIELAKNFGQHGALMAGYRYCTGDIIVSLDDDGQAPLDYLGEMLSTLGDDCDVVFGVHKNYTHGIFRLIGTKVNDLMFESLLGKPKDIMIDSFHVMKRFVMDEIIKYESSYPYVDGLLLRTTDKVKNVETKQRERISGKSNYTIKKLISLFLNGITAFSVKPLRISTYAGCIVALAGFILAIVTIIRKLANSDLAEGYASILAAILLIGGMILVMLGMIGEYIGRIYLSLNRSPQYVIGRSINCEEKE